VSTWVLLKISTLLAGNWPQLAATAASTALKLLVQGPAKKYLQTRAQRKAFNNAMDRAILKFSHEKPHLVACLFDEHFIKHHLASELVKLLSRCRDPSAGEIEQRYAAQFIEPIKRDMADTVQLLIQLTEEELKEEPTLQEVLTHRQSDESNRILRRVFGTDGTLVPAASKSVPQAPADLNSNISLAFQAASVELLSWPQTLDGKAWLDRSELISLHDRIEGSETSTTLVLGEPGVGKSALLSRLGNLFKGKGYAVLALKADLLPEELGTYEGLREYLEFPCPVNDAVAAMAAKSRVLILVDQLDALGELVDLRTQRLTVMLRLVKQLAGMKNVHVLCSCRSFERVYDKRLNTIDAEEVTLELPAWSQVEVILLERGINAATWPQDFKNLLRVPQYLKLFLKHFTGTAEARIFESHQAMLEEIWGERILKGPPGKAGIETLERLSEYMSTREVLFAPLAMFDADRPVVDQLVATGLLQHQANKLSVSFAHQTIFDFARARSFITHGESLSNHVLARQSSLFIRPKLWSALNYLRATDSVAYETALNQLWSATNLRKHLRTLIIDFIGQLEDPSVLEFRIAKEAATVFGLLGFVLQATCGRQRWFDALKPNLLLDAIRSDVRTAAVAISTLQQALAFARDEVLDLLKNHWMKSDELRRQALFVIRNLAEWDEKSVAFASAIVGTTALDNSTVMDLASAISVAAPQKAPRVIAIHLKAALEAAEAANYTEPSDEAESGDSDFHSIAERIERREADPLRKILHPSRTEWYEVSAVAEAAPAEYLAEVWPIARAIVEHYAKRHESRSLYNEDYLSSSELDLDGGDERRLEYPLFDSFGYAVKKLAATDVAEFKKFVAANEGSRALTVQRLIALGLLEIAPHETRYVAGYLLGDRRRLHLGSFRHNYGDTRRILKAIAESVEKDEVSALETEILAFDPYVDAYEKSEGEKRLEIAKWRRQYQMSLLSALPAKWLSSGARGLLPAQGLPADREAAYPEVWTSTSPMSATKMAAASDTTIQRFLAAFPDNKEWGDVFTRSGGSVEVSREFAEFAKTAPERAIAIALTLDPATSQRPAAYMLDAVAGTKLPLSALIDLFLGLVGKGFDGNEFRAAAASALRNRTRRPEGLPDPVLKLFETWLEDDAVAVDEPVETSQAREPQATSMLWESHRLHILPGGSYPILDAYFMGLYARGNALGSEEANRILRQLERRLTKGDRIAIWIGMAYGVLQRLGAFPKAEAEQFLTRLFVAYPALTATHAGVVLIARAIAWADPELTRNWLMELKVSENPLSQQAFGELTVLRAVLVKSDSFSVAEIESALSDQEPKMVLLGMTFAAVHLWLELDDPKLLTPILVAAFGSPDKDVSRAAMDWYRLSGGLSWDSKTRPVLEATYSGSAAFLCEDDSYLLDRISDVIDDAPDFVAAICEKIIDARNSNLGNFASSAVMEAETLLSISLTLQRQPEPSKSKGLDLFEKLQAANAYKVREVLVEIDRRPTGGSPQSALRRRRRRPRVKRT
jgi:hypothetical protein